MAEPKTKPSNESVVKFLGEVKDEKRRQDCFAVLELMKQATKAEPQMWGPSIVGFGSYHYKYASGREGDWPIIAFSPRKDSLTLYLVPGFSNSNDLLKKLGKHKTGKGCLYIKSLGDVDLSALKKLIQQSVKEVKSGSVRF